MSTTILHEMSDKCGLGVFHVEDDILPDLVDVAKDYAYYEGLVTRKLDLPFDYRSFLSFSLLPTPFPEYWFSYAKNIQRDMNHVIHKIAHSRTFLKDCLEKTIESDEFTANIWKIYETVQNEGVAQPISLGLLRCDYMLNSDSLGNIKGIKQVENNTISISFSGLAPGITKLHRFMLNRIGQSDSASRLELPVNDSAFDAAKGLIAAWNMYGNRSAVILFVLEKVVLNICDQRAIEFAIYELDKTIQILRCTFCELQRCTELRGRKLFVEGKEVAIVYYRTGYVPDDYSPEDWNLRLMMERSLAIKCPTAGYHLAGTKRVQLQLSRPGILEAFLPENCNAEMLRLTFADFYSLDLGIEGDKAVELAKQHPENFVMKPEREGGGNNEYGENIKVVLDRIGHTNDRQSYILMERINPPCFSNCLVQSKGLCHFKNVVSELGIYGVILGTQKEVFENFEAGHVMKTKEIGIDEGGIAAGFAALDSPYLTKT